MPAPSRSAVTNGRIVWDESIGEPESCTVMKLRVGGLSRFARKSSSLVVATAWLTAGAGGGFGHVMRVRLMSPAHGQLQGTPAAPQLDPGRTGSKLEEYDAPTEKVLFDELSVGPCTGTVRPDSVVAIW